MSRVQEIIAAIDCLSDDERNELNDLLRVSPNEPPENINDADLEKELLKAIEGPYEPYSTGEMRNLVDRVIHESRVK